MNVMPKREPLDEEFRAVGMTGEARNFPRSATQIRMFAAWLGYPVEQLPDTMKYFANASAKKSWEAAEAAVKLYYNHNPPTVAVGVVGVGIDFNPSILAIRRKLPDGYGKLALPGGFQEMGETLEQAVTREVFEETGIQLDPTRWRHHRSVTVEGNKNLAFFVYADLLPDIQNTANDEVLELVKWTPRSGVNMVASLEMQMDDWAFSTHAESAYHQYFGILR